MDVSLHNPKCAAAARNGKAGWYPYYAGYSPAFVGDVLTILEPPKDCAILDPWNGSGTTTQIARERSFDVFGYDLNPAMVLIAKARNLGSGVAGSVESLADDIVSQASHPTLTQLCPSREPLSSWLCPGSAQYIRHVERSIQKVLIHSSDVFDFATAKSLASISDLACFFYVALFRTVRAILNKFFASNPTWLKFPRQKAGRVRPEVVTVNAEFRAQVVSMKRLLAASEDLSESSRAAIDTAHSDALPLRPRSIDIIISSPPYCTRIDYAVCTRAELAVLGFEPDGFRSLREHLIGTATVAKAHSQPSAKWGTCCLNFLDQVANHPSKASRSYYLKNHTQYFNAIYRSLTEINRTLRPGGHCVLVVQDSFYKEVRNDLPKVLVEMAGAQSWALFRRDDFPCKRTMAGLNGQASQYRKQRSATESVLWFSKPRDRRS